MSDIKKMINNLKADLRFYEIVKNDAIYFVRYGEKTVLLESFIQFVMNDKLCSESEAVEIIFDKFRFIRDYVLDR